ncbi:MAG: PRC-barrel domain-containing protein [Candidatus Methanodesulfokora sp.]
MAKKISELYKMPVFSTEGKYLGEVEDFIMDDAKGQVAEIVVSQKKEKRRIPYELVKACADIYIVQV